MKKILKFISVSLCLVLVLSMILKNDFAVFASESTDGSVSVDKSIKWIDVNEGLAEVTVTVHANDQNITTQITKTTDIVLVLDVSNSMKGNKLKNAKTAASNFASAMLEKDSKGKIKIAVVEYCNEATTLTEFSDSMSTVLNAISKVSTPSNEELGGTNIQAGLKTARTMLEASLAENKFVILLSDGEPTYSYEVEDVVFTVTQEDSCINGIYHNVKITDCSYDIKAIDYNTIIGNGSDYTFHNSFTENIPIYCSHEKFVKNYKASLPNNHGVATIYEASAIENASIYSIGFGIESGSNAEDVLSQVADQGQYFLSDISQDEISKVFNKIQTSVDSQISAGEEASLSSGNNDVYVGNTSDKVLANYTVIEDSISVDLGSAVLKDGEVDWTIGRLPNGSATLIYQIKIDMSTIPYGNIISIAPSSLTYRPYIGEQLSLTTTAIESQILNNLEFYRVVFQNADENGTVVKKQYVDKGGSATVPAINPTKQDTQQYKYTFIGWKGNYANVNKDEIVIAEYESKLQEYNVSFYLDGTLVKTETVEYGKDAAPPTIEKDESKIYSDWIGRYTNVTKDEEVRMTSTVKTFTVTFYLDGNVLKTETVEYGKDAIPPTIEKEESKNYSDWIGSYTNVTKDEEVNMTSTVKTFTVTFYLDGNVVKTETVEYGKDATAPVIEKEESKNYSDWVGRYTNVTKDEEVKMTSTVKTFTVTFYLDGNVIKTDVVSYGKDAIPPTIEKDESKNYSDWVGRYTNVTKDEEVKMTSTVKTFTVTFYLDGNVVKTDVVAYGKDAIPPTIEKDESKNYSDWVGTYTNVTKNEEVRMTSSVKTFTVTFYLDGNVIKTDVVAYGKDAIPPTIEKEESKNYSDWVGSYTNVIKDEEVRMTSTVKTFTVTFYLDGNVIKTDVVSYGKDAIPPTIEKEESKNYSDWVGSYTNVTKNEEVRMTSSVKTFTVTFYLDGNVIKTDVVAYGKDATAPVIEKEESKTYSDWVGSYTNVTKNEEVRMTSSVKTFTVTFYLNGNVVKTDVVAYGKDAIPPTIEKEESKTYSDWVGRYTNVTKDEEVKMTSSVKTFTVTFYLDGNVIKTDVVSYGKDAIPPIIEKEESKNYSDWIGRYTNVTKDEEVNMTSTVKTFTVTFYLDGNVVKTETVEYGKDAAAPVIEKEESKNYSDWVGNYTNVTKDEEVRITSSVKMFTVSFYLDGTLVKTETVEYGKDAKAPVIKKEESKNYSDWVGSYTNVTKDEEVRMTSSVKTFTVTFVDNDGSTVLATDIVNYGEDAYYNGVTPSKPSNVNFTYTFKGWDKEFTKITSDLIVIAQYSAIPAIIVDEEIVPESPITPTVVPSIKPTEKPVIIPSIVIDDEDTPAGSVSLPEAGTRSKEEFYLVGCIILLLGVSLVSVTRGKKA